MRLIVPFVATLLLAFSSIALYGQITILDFEAPETSTTFQYFGSDLDGTVNEIIANPNPTGVNTSSMVATHVKPAASEPFAGAFSNPNPSTPVDLTNATQICMDVHFSQEGSVSLKLENSTNGVANWLQTQPVTTVNDWEQVCFDISVNGEEDPMTPAEGGIFNTVTLFFDFETVLDEERVYYFDNITTDGTSSEMISITINLGTSGLDSVSTDGIFLAGGGTFGNPGDNPMADPDGDGVYTITFMQPSGFQSFYTFTNGNCPDYSCKEMIEGQDCANPDNFNDRFMGPITQDTVINTCFEECTTTTDCTVNSTELLEKGIEFSVLPTLTTGELLLSFGNQPLPQSQLQVVTPQGQVLKQWTLDGAYQQTINISNLPAGMYFITLEHEGARGVQRVIKQ
ncbi:MAG: T9SS type A sorting domain-containing protein [Bacteroidetes bacterium]|jgi:hypothetical protein|nr:T9SS type A sorting domain-containing protein [Bacteroidota bacterium]